MNRVTMWLPRKAGADIGANLLVKPSAVETVVKAAAAADAVIGVTGRDGAKSGETVDVAVQGIVDVKAGAAVTRGDLIGANASGEGIGVSAAGNRYVGVALESAADEDIFPVLLGPGQVK